MAQNLFSNDPSQLAENRSSRDMAWKVALNNLQTPGASNGNQTSQQKALDFNAWTPGASPQIPIIQPPVMPPEPEPAPESSGSEFDLEAFLNQFNPDGTMKPPPNKWGDYFYASNEVPQGKPVGSLRDTVTRSGTGQAIGSGVGMMMGGPVGAAAMGGTVGAITGALSGGGAFGSGKGPGQRARDVIRQDLKNRGFLTEDNQIRLPNGTYFDMGKDGNARLQNGLRYYETDTSNPITEHVVNMVKPVAAILTGGDEALTGDISAYLTNAAMQNGGTYEGAREAVVSMLRNLGVNKVETLVDELQQLRASGAISEEEFSQLNANALALGKKNRDEAIRQAMAASQAVQQQQQQGQPQANIQGVENRGASESPLLKNMSAIVQQRRQDSQPAQQKGGMNLVNFLQGLRARQTQQAGSNVSNTSDNGIRTYSNPRYK